MVGTSAAMLIASLTNEQTVSVIIALRIVSALGDEMLDLHKAPALGSSSHKVNFVQQAEGAGKTEFPT